MGIIETIRLITREEAQQQKIYEFVKNMLQATDFDTAKIASLVGVPEGFVVQVKKGLESL